jgi:hypothetical protein
VIVVRGSLDTLVVPLVTFEPSPTGLTPDFDRFRIVDNGQTLAFGDYEATVDAILYEHDAAYRASPPSPTSGLKADRLRAS